MIILPDIRVYDFTAQGRWELRNDWSERVNQNLLLTLRRTLEKRSYTVRVFTADDPSLNSEMAEILALYEAVNTSIRLHTFGPQVFPQKVDHFEYSLGDLGGLLRSRSWDSFVLVGGFHQVLRNTGRTGVSMALADSSGSILWYCMKVFEGDHDLRDPNGAEMIVESMLASFSPEDK
jgi:hypothetical protein